MPFALKCVAMTSFHIFKDNNTTRFFIYIQLETICKTVLCGIQGFNTNKCLDVLKVMTPD